MRQHTNITAMKCITLLLLFFFLCFNNGVDGAEENQPETETGNELVGKMRKQVEDAFAQNEKHKKALKALVSKPLTDAQQELLNQLLPHTGPLEETLSRAPYLTYLKTEVREVYKDFPAYVAAMPTAKQKTTMLFSFKKALPPKTKAEALSICTDYYFKLRLQMVEEPDFFEEMQALITFQTKHLMQPLMALYPPEEIVSHLSGLTQMATVSNMRVMTDTEVFHDVWREWLKKHGSSEGLLRCAIATPAEFALTRSFFEDTAAFEKWIQAPLKIEKAPEKKKDQKDSLLHLIPEQTLGLVYCPNLLELDNSIHTLKTELLSEPQASDVSVEILSNVFGSQFADLIALEEIFNVNRDFAIILTRLEPLQFGVLAHLRNPEILKQIMEKVTEEAERTVYNGVTYWNDNEKGEIIAILDDILLFSKHGEVCEHIIDTYNGTIQAITKNPDYVSFLTDISEDNDQLAVYFDVETTIASLNSPLEEELEVVIDKLEAADEADHIAPFLKDISEVGIPFIRQVRSASVRLQTEGADVQIKPFLKFKNGSEFLEVFEEGSNELGFLGELPDRTLINGAFQGSPKFLTEISTSWFRFLPKGDPEAKAQREELLEQMKHFYKSLADRWSFSLNFGDTLLPQYLFIYELKDEESAKTYMDETILEKLDWTEAYRGQSILHNRVEIKSYIFPNFKVDIPAVFAEAFADANDLILTDLMPPEWHWYYAFTEGQLLFTMGTSPELIMMALDRKAGVGDRFSEHLSYQGLVETLRTDNNVLLAISPIAALKSMLKSVGEVIPSLQLFLDLLTSLPENYSLGFAAKAKNNGIDANLLLNLGDFKQLVEMFGMMGHIMPQMMQMQ